MTYSESLKIARPEQEDIQRKISCHHRCGLDYSTKYSAGGGIGDRHQFCHQNCQNPFLVENSQFVKIDGKEVIP